MSTNFSSYFKNYHQRFFFLYGKTDDEFCPPALGILKLEEMLHRHLKSLGYRRILFFNGRQKLYFHDHESRSLIRRNSGGQQSGPVQTKTRTAGTRTTKMCAGPLGQRKIRRKEEAVQSVASQPSAAQSPPEVSLHLGRMNDMEMVGLMDHCMKDEQCKTAVIFTDGLDFINHTQHEAVRQMGACLRQWSEHFSTNENLCLFMMPDMNIEAVRQLLGRYPQWSFLMSKMFERQDRPSQRMIYVGSPRRDEVEHLFHYWRLKRNLETDWLALPETVIDTTRRLCSEGSTLKSLSASLCRSESLKADVLRRLSGKAGQEPAMERLKNIKGLEGVARKIQRFITLRKEEEELSGNGDTREQGAEDKITVERLLPPKPPTGRRLNLHLAFTGNPGTGKTTVARLLGEIFRENGLLELGHVVKASREDLVAGYVGQTALRTAEKVAEAMGGILFVDEAYRLTQGGENDFGREAVETIMEAMSDHTGEFAVIIAGYPKRIQEFLDANPGLRRRFGEVIHIADYDPPVLQHIFEQTVARHNRRLDNALQDALPDFFSNWYTVRNPETFGNAGEVIKLYEKMDVHRAERVHETECDREQRLLLTLADVPEDLRQHLKPRKEALEDILQSLDALVGLRRVKQMVRSAMNRLRIEKLRGGDTVLAPGHYLFTGNPGTGKTTVARKMCEMFRALGLLKKGHLVETGRSDLVAGYMGQTALKTREVLERSLDGVLFIDEAYQLIEGERDSFGREALETLVAFMENHKDRLCIIAAGYPEPMHRFVNQNPGLPSRFTAEIIFDNYSAEEMLDIFRLMAEGRKMILGKGVEETLLSRFRRWEAQAGPTFGNGREVLKLLEVMCTRQSDRLVKVADSLDPGNRDVLFRLEQEDVPEVLSSLD